MTPEEPAVHAHAPTNGVPTPQADIAALGARLHAVEQLITIFRLERYVYLAVSLISFAVLISFAAYTLHDSEPSGRNALFALMFAAPSGALVWVSAAFLKMWTQALQVLSGKLGEP